MIERRSTYPQLSFPLKIQKLPAPRIGGGTESLTLAQDSTGRFWIAYTWNSTVYVAYSLDDDMHWSAPFAAPVLNAVESSQTALGTEAYRAAVARGKELQAADVLELVRDLQHAAGAPVAGAPAAFCTVWAALT